jgi:hypothetical protein
VTAPNNLALPINCVDDGQELPRSHGRCDTASWYGGGGSVTGCAKALGEITEGDPPMGLDEVVADHRR